MKTILLVDDHATTLDTLTWLLESQGYRCLRSTTIAYAEQTFIASNVDLVITDHRIGGESGVRLAALLKQHNDVPIILFTGNVDLIGKPAEVDLVLLKPLNPDEILGFVSALIREEQYDGRSSGNG